MCWSMRPLRPSLPRPRPRGATMLSPITPAWRQSDIAEHRAAYVAQRIADALASGNFELATLYSEASWLVDLIGRLRAEEARRG